MEEMALTRQQIAEAEDFLREVGAQNQTDTAKHIRVVLGALRKARDANGNVHMVAELRAGGIKLGAYRVKDPETGDLSTIQFHMTDNNYVCAVMGQEAS